MIPENTYSSGEFSKRANVSIRTIRYYDKIGLLKPTFITDAGHRLYTDPDFMQLQKIIILKKLGFSLDDILMMTHSNIESNNLIDSFDLQLNLIQKKLKELKQIESYLLESTKLLSQSNHLDWDKLISYFHLMNMQETLQEQYKNSKNTDIRIQLHRKYSTNPIGWYPWIYSIAPAKPNDHILELGCGNGQFWIDNLREIHDVSIVLSDKSEGMLSKAKARISDAYSSQNTDNHVTIDYQCFDCSMLPFKDHQFDCIYANHLLFYIKDFDTFFKEIKRVLKPDGFFCCTTYGKSHMKEIDHLVKSFDERIALSEINLFDLFGLDNGIHLLNQYFSNCKCFHYPDSLLVTDPKDLLKYIYSCHGNQMHYLNEQIESFETFITKKVGSNGFKITKDAGLFVCSLQD